MRELRVAEQLFIVFLIAVLLPLCIVTLIIVNVNQHSVRKELENSVNIVANGVYQRLSSIIDEKKLTILYLAKSLNYIKSEPERKQFFRELMETSKDSNEIELVNKRKETKAENYIPDFNDSSIEMFHDKQANNLIIYAKVKNDSYIKQCISLNALQLSIFKHLINDEREVYILDSKKNIIMSYLKNNKNFSLILSRLPKEYEPNLPVGFGESKNQPNIFLKLSEPNWSIVVSTPRKITKTAIIDAKYKIIVALLIAAISIIVIGVLYSYSLSRNIRQFLKAISAIRKGNYARRIRLISNILTPLELVSLVDEFNDMASEVNKSHKDLKEANNKLSKLDEIRSNLIDTVSHEFRTPLTCIKGYTSRLLRNEARLDLETKQKSLRVIKQQTERLSRLVEDLLVIPDIESFLLRIFPDDVNLKELIELCILSIQQKQARNINLDIEEDFPIVYADPDRLEQVIINLLDNAIKYSISDTEINIKVAKDNNEALVFIQNSCEPIRDIDLNSLFEKFSRLEDTLTRTTRGTGLGLFVAKGLVNSMGGNISLSAQNGFEVKFSIPLKLESTLVSSRIQNAT